MRNSRFRLLLTSALWLLASSAPAAPAEPTENLKHGPVIAIIIDDMGYRKSAIQALLSIPAPLTFSVIPFTPYSKLAAQQAHAHHREVMVHMPMETLSSRRWETALTTTMSEQTLRELSTAMITSIPYASGVNNHGGSLFTQRKDAMATLMSSLHENGLFFVDSRTTAESAACESAYQAGVPLASRDIFLDNQRQPLLIKKQLQRLRQIALKHGQALGIAHPHSVTINVLAAELPKLQSEGIRIVPVSSFIKRLQSRNTLAEAMQTLPIQFGSEHRSRQHSVVNERCP